MNAELAGLKITEAGDRLLLHVHVQPRASRTELCGVHDGELRLRLTSPPVDDAANRLCVEFLAKTLGVARSRVTITAGQKSRHKTIAINGLDRATLIAQLSMILETKP